MKNAQSAMIESDSKDAEIDRLKKHIQMLEGTLKTDQETLTKVWSLLAKAETERDFAALQISGVQGELYKVKRELDESRQVSSNILDKFRGSDEYEVEVAEKSSLMIKKTRERSDLMMNSNGDWVGFSEEFI